MAEKKKLQGRSSSQDSPAHIRNARGNNFKVWGKDEDAWANEEFQSNQLAQQLRKAKRQKETLLEQDGNDALSKTRELLGILTYGPEYLEAFDGELFRELVKNRSREQKTDSLPAYKRSGASGGNRKDSAVNGQQSKTAIWL